MTDREVMKMALDALEQVNKLSIGENAICLPAEIDTAMDALRQALAQPEQEKESTALTVDSRLLLGRSNNFTKETKNRLCDIERRLATIETQPTLSQPEQEPVAWMLPDYGDVLSASEADGTGIYNIPLYTAPPKREWVGLTDEERRHFNNRLSGSGVAEEIEANLKEKNT